MLLFRSFGYWGYKYFLGICCRFSLGLSVVWIFTWWVWLWSMVNYLGDLSWRCGLWGSVFEVVVFSGDWGCCGWWWEREWGLRISWFSVLFLVVGRRCYWLVVWFLGLGGFWRRGSVVRFWRMSRFEGGGWEIGTNMDRVWIGLGCWGDF